MKTTVRLSTRHLFAILVVSLAAGLRHSQAEEVQLSATEKGRAEPVGFRARITGSGGKIVLGSAPVTVKR
jgi:hypothetical protein